MYTAGKLYQRLKRLLYKKELVNKNNGYSHFTFITVVNLLFGHIQCLQAGACNKMILTYMYTFRTVQVMTLFVRVENNDLLLSVSIFHLKAVKNIAQQKKTP